MRLIDGYTLHKALRSNRRSEVYLATRLADGADVVLKTYRDDESAESEAQLRHELDALRIAAGPGVPAGLGLIESSGTTLLVLARAPGGPLAEWVAQGGNSVLGIVEVAMAVAAVLARVHAKHWIHRDITPHNILVEPATRRTHLIDFEFARPIGSHSLSLGSSLGSKELAGAPHYIAPEQTGRMNRGLDARSDLYSFGATLYFGLVGRPPFDLEDMLALVHAHMARLPESPTELRHDVPVAISRIVLKLLQKEPAERYQSARALLADLRECHAQLTAHGRIDEALPLGVAEAPDRPRFSRRLHGRESEIAALREFYAQARAGSRHLVMIRGESGTGKSSLVDELRPLLAESGGYLAIGKFDLYRARAYGGWQLALASLVQQILLESDARLERWRDELRAGLGNIAQVLVDLVPDLRFILGECAPVPPLGTREAQARLSLALQRFIGVCATSEHPIVLFLDDLQWSDAASRFLLEDLLASDLQAALLLLGAYRANEVGPGHALLELLARFEERRAPVTSLELRPLERSAAIGMLREALDLNESAVSALAELVERKTGNTPLLVQQFVEHLHNQELIRYEPGSGWVGDLNAIAAADIPDGAVAFMTAKLARLDAGPRELLEFASCVGDEFNVDLLCELSQRAHSSVEQSLFALCDAGLIGPCPNGFRFLHDRIREAAQVPISAAARAALHYEMARLLLARIPAEEQPARVFEIVGHLNRGIALLPEELRWSAVSLNHTAGKRSLVAGDASAAAVYLDTARGLLREEDWHEQRALGFDLFLQSAESASQKGDFETALAVLEALDRRAPSRFEFAQIAAKRIQVYAFVQRPQDCVQYMLKVMRALGVRWPAHPSRLRARLALRWIEWKLHGRDAADALQPARSVDLDWLAPIFVIGQSGGVMVRHDIHLTALASCLVLRRYLSRGYIARVAFTVASYANYLQVILSDSAGASRFARSALALNQRAWDPLFGPRCEMQIYGMLYPWLMPRRQALAHLDRVTESMREVGDVEYAYYTTFLKSCYLALGGERVPDAQRRLAQLAESVRRAGHRFPEAEQCARAYRLLTVGPSAPEIATEVANHDAWIAANPGWAQPYARTMWLLVLCVHGHYDLAFAQSEKLNRELRLVAPFVHVADYTFYRGLAAAALASAARGMSRRRYQRIARTSLRRLERWARGGPDFGHMQLLLEAELARLRGQVQRALTLYAKSTRRAHEREFPHHMALAEERRARLLIEHRRRTDAHGALSEAIAHYRAWGAPAKASALKVERKALRI